MVAAVMQLKSLFDNSFVFLPGTGYSSNTIFIRVSSETVLVVDVGTPENVGRVFSVLNKYFSNAKKAILVTSHEHYDHVGGFASFCQTKSCSICASEETASVLTKGDSIYSVANLFGESLTPVSIDKVLKENDIFSTNLGHFKVIETPGHSRGSLCLYNKEKRVLIAGDTVFPSGSFGRIDLPGGDLNLLKESISKLKELHVDVLVSGHGDIVFTNGDKHIMMALDLIQML